MVRLIAVFLTGFMAVALPAQDFKTVAEGNFTFVYRIDGLNLVGKVSCPTQGWVAIGFNPTRVMKDANLIMGYADGTVSVVVDQFGAGMFEHAADTIIGGKNNLIAGVCQEVKDTTVLSFTIPLSSGDPKDGAIMPGAKTTVIFACGKKDDLKTKHNKTAKTTIVF